MSDPLYLALDALYERGWVEHYKGRKFDPRGTIQWQAVLDIFRQHGGSKSVRVYFRRHGSATEDHVDVVGNPTDHVSVSLITRVEPTPPSTAPHAPAKAREVTEADVERALGALNRRIIDGRQFWSEEDRTLMRAALATFAEGAE